VKTVGAHTANPDMWIDVNQPLHADYYVLSHRLSTSRFRILGYAPRTVVENAYQMDVSPAIDWPANRVRVVYQDQLYPIPWTVSLIR
jgi:hypothetical protein